MADLTPALNRILTWLEVHQPTTAAGFQPGLSPNAIAQTLSTLPFQVSPEVYELYRWRNGDQTYSSVFGYLWFLNLADACEAAAWVNHQDLLELRQQAQEPLYLMPLFDFEGEYFAVQGGDALTETAPIFHVSDCYELSYAFVSLTAMMLAIAECYETGVYAISEANLIEVVDPVKFGEIRRQYNPGTVAALYADGW